MKRMTAICLALILALSVFSGCSTGRSEAEQFYNGDWYGWWMITNSTVPDLADDDSQTYWYDCMANFRFLLGGAGFLTIWDEDDSGRDDPIASIPIQLDEQTKIVTSRKDGWFYESDVGEGDLVINPSDAYYENNLVFEIHYEVDEGSFDGYFFLCPWGNDWHEIREDNPDILPYGFESWYLPKIEAGEKAPDKIELDYDAIESAYNAGN